MYMSDYVEQLDKILSTAGKEILTDAGTISHKQAIEKAQSEYKKFIAKNLSPVEKEYLNAIKMLEKTSKKKAKQE